MSSIRLQYYDITSCKQPHLIVKHYWSKEVSTCYNHRKFGKVSSINKRFIAFSKKVHVFLRHPVIFRSHHAIQSYRLGTNRFHQSLCTSCDLDLWPSDIVLAHDTSSCHDYHLCHIIFKSHHAIQSYMLDINRFHWSLCTMFKCKLWPWPLTYQYGSCMQHVVLSWWSFVPYYFLIPWCRTKLWAGHDTGTHKGKHTHGQVRLYMPSHHVMVGA